MRLRLSSTRLPVRDKDRLHVASRLRLDLKQAAGFFFLGLFLREACVDEVLLGVGVCVCLGFCGGVCEWGVFVRGGPVRLVHLGLPLTFYIGADVAGNLAAHVDQVFRLNLAM
jgi:hypothetical protein